MSARFDFGAFKRAFETKDAEVWAAFYAQDALWTEYRHSNPPRSPNRKEGRRNIAEFLRKIEASSIRIRIEDELVGETQAAFRVWVDLPDGKKIVEHVIIHFPDGKITTQVDVEAWD